MEKVWVVRLTAEINDEVDVYVEEGATDEEVIEAANRDWSFVEAESWGAKIVRRPEEDDVE